MGIGSDSYLDADSDVTDRSQLPSNLARPTKRFPNVDMENGGEKIAMLRTVLHFLHGGAART